VKLRNPYAIRGAAFGGAFFLKALSRTLRVRVRSRDGAEHPRDPNVEPCIYAFWHESMLAPTHIKAKVQILLSRSADGDLLARVCHHLGVGVVRGSSSKGGAQALFELAHAGRRRESNFLLTPDGPRGPRRTVQPGIVFLASRTGLPIVPVGVGFTRAWRARSWDRFAVPLPFSTMTGIIGRPLHVPDNLSAEGLSYHQRQLEQALRAATTTAERWAARAPRRTFFFQSRWNSTRGTIGGMEHATNRIGRRVA
jgi:lysophospholipid acyltransferase (LPLAT)-like uncharacterized protein